jgi:hypothetical protein
MAIFNFMIKLGDFLSPTDKTPGSPSVWIVDDLTVVTSRAQCEAVVKYITTEGPTFGLRPSHGKLEAYSPYITTNHPLALTLAENGFVDTSNGPTGVPRVSATGLHRLLGAPIGPEDFCCSSTGQIAEVAANASAFATAVVAKLSDCYAQYLLLRYCGSTLMHHLARLCNPTVLEGHSKQFETLLIDSTQSILSSQKPLNERQRQQVGLTGKEGGTGMVSVASVRHAAYIGACGAAARFMKTIKRSSVHDRWWDAAEVLARIPSRPAAERARAFNQDIIRTMRQQTKLKIPDLDPYAPDTWPTQAALSKLTHRLRADKLESDLVSAGDLVEASWFSSGRGMGGGDWLNVIPVGRLNAPSATFQVMLCNKLLHDIPGTEMLDRCACGHTDLKTLRNGVHWLTECNLAGHLAEPTIRHSDVSREADGGDSDTNKTED